jgi:hypothetical protein
VLDQLVSETGIVRRVTRKDFRSALEQGCGICIPFYASLACCRDIYSEAELQNFWVFDDQDPKLDDQELVIYYMAEIHPDEVPYNVQALRVDAFSGCGREVNTLGASFYLHADQGNMLSISPFLHIGIIFRLTH